MNYQEIIIKYKPNIKQSSLSSYIKTLETIQSYFNDKEFYKNFDLFIEYNKNFKITTQKNKLSAVIVLLKGIGEDELLINKYSDAFKILNVKYNDWLNLNEKTDTQNKNWIEYEQLKEVADDLLKQFNKIIKNKIISNEEYKILLFTVMIYTHLYIPFRNDLHTIIRVTADDLKNTEYNYLVDTDTIILNNYKTSKVYGQQTYKLPPKLKTIYNKFFKFNTSKYLITSIKDRYKKINSNTYTKYLNLLFSKYYPSKKISSSMIRHIIISQRLKNTPSIQQEKDNKNNTINLFQHSETMNKIYRKL